MLYQRGETVQCDLIGRYITISIPAGSFLTLCEVEAFSALQDDEDSIITADNFGIVHFGEDNENILLGKAASSSSIYSEEAIA